jgi:hypothetical protein
MANFFFDCQFGHFLSPSLQIGRTTIYRRKQKETIDFRVFRKSFQLTWPYRAFHLQNRSHVTLPVPFAGWVAMTG